MTAAACSGTAGGVDNIVAAALAEAAAATFATTRAGTRSSSAACDREEDQLERPEPSGEHGHPAVARAAAGLGADAAMRLSSVAQGSLRCAHTSRLPDDVDTRGGVGPTVQFPSREPTWDDDGYDYDSWDFVDLCARRVSAAAGAPSGVAG